MIKLLIGGSPCTYWSIAQKNNRETEPSGMGWELFKNYLIAKEKFAPDFFLYENNKSADEAIKCEIRKQFGFGGYFEYGEGELKDEAIEAEARLKELQGGER